MKTDKKAYYRLTNKDFKITTIHEMHVFKIALNARIKYMDKFYYSYKGNEEIKNKIDSFLNLLDNFVNSKSPYDNIKPHFVLGTEHKIAAFYEELKSLREFYKGELERLREKIKNVISSDVVLDAKTSKFHYFTSRINKVTKQQYNSTKGVYSKLSNEEKTKRSKYIMEKSAETKNALSGLLNCTAPKPILAYKIIENLKNEE